MSNPRLRRLASYKSASATMDTKSLEEISSLCSVAGATGVQRRPRGW